MEVILTHDVPKLGKVGDILKVKDGFARNYLLPNNLAFLATQNNLKKIEQEKKKRQERSEAELAQAKALAEKISKVSVTVSVEVNDLEKLYGSVTEIDIAKALEIEGYTVNKKDILLEKPIETLGIFEVVIRLHSEVTTPIRLWVTKK